MPFTPYHHPPDFEGFASMIRGRSAPARVYQAELYLDGKVQDQLCARFGLDHQPGPERDVELARALGYDMVRVHCPDSEFTMEFVSSAALGGPPQRTSQGYIVHEHGGPVQNWKDFEEYPWPRIAELDTRPLEWAESNLPDGMKGYDLSVQVFEASTWLLGYESLFMGIYEQPDLVEAIVQRVGETYLAYTRLLCQFDSIGVIWGTDDMGFRSQTLVSPDWIRDNILPWHKEAARIAHEAGKLYFLHSCGQIEALMADIIDDVGIDAKHSFEDPIVPVAEFYERYHDRIGVLGGLDVDFLSRASEESVRQRTREVLASCHARGRYALGTGNSVTDYVRLENYLAMLEEGQRFGRA